MEFTINRSVEAQADVIASLNGLVSHSLQEHNLTDEDIILLPTGDGICIAIINPMLEYDIHMQIALSILQNVNTHNTTTEDEMRRFQIRMGLSENVDNILLDINGRKNVAGAGINMASRVMGLGDGGQVLVSVSVRETLMPREKYIKAFKAFKAGIKHNLVIDVYQFIQPNHEGLNVDVPSIFCKKIIPDPRLSQFEAYYFANAMKYESLFLSKYNKFTSGGYTMQTLLWYLAQDSNGRANQTLLDPHSPRIYGDGKLAIDDCYNYYDGIDFWVRCDLSGFICKSLQHLDKYFTGNTPDQKFVFLNEMGKEKLKDEHPSIWREFCLDQNK